MPTFGNRSARADGVLLHRALVLLCAGVIGRAADADALPDRLPPVSTPREIAFPVAFPSVAERVYWSAEIPLDLGHLRYIELELCMEGEGRPRYMSLDFRSGAGWCGTKFSALGGTHHRVFLTREDFVAEGRPSGWSQVDAVRLAVWRNGNPAPARLVVHSIRAWAPTALALVGSSSVHPTEEREVAIQAARRVGAWLGGGPGCRLLRSQPGTGSGNGLSRRPVCRGCDARAMDLLCLAGHVGGEAVPAQADVRVSGLERIRREIA